MSEAKEIGFEFTLEDHCREGRQRSGNYSEFESMLHYHGMSVQEYEDESNNSKRNLWWNYREFGREAERGQG